MAAPICYAIPDFNAHVRYPARVQLVAAMNPCTCGHAGLGRGHRGKAPRCQQAYQSKVSGPLMDRIDLVVETPPVSAADMSLPPAAEGGAEVAARVARARDLQSARAREGGDGASPLNARSAGGWLDMIASRTPRLTRTVAELHGAEGRRAFTRSPWGPSARAWRGGGRSCSRSDGGRVNVAKLRTCYFSLA